MTKAIGLLSGGLDSILATCLLQDQGIDILAISFQTPFFGTQRAQRAAAQLKVPLRTIDISGEHLQLVRNPRYGYGKNMNPCIDCRILSLKKAGEYMRQIGALFLFTGEVLGQRPMSQHKKALNIVERDSGLQGYILRPLSAAHLEPTIPEQEGWVDRNALLDISGRTRKPQISLAKEKGLTDYPNPAGGCLLTDKSFSDRFRDYLQYTEKPLLDDVHLLKVGRHFRLENGDKVIVARDEKEAQLLMDLYQENDHLLIPEDFSGPVVMLQGESLDMAIKKMMQYTKKALPKDARINHWHKGVKQIHFLAGLQGAGDRDQEVG